MLLTPILPVTEANSTKLAGIIRLMSRRTRCQTLPIRLNHHPPHLLQMLLCMILSQLTLP